MMVRWAHGHASDTYRWYLPAAAGKPDDPSAVTRSRNTDSWRRKPPSAPSSFGKGAALDGAASGIGDSGGRDRDGVRMKAGPGPRRPAGIGSRRMRPVHLTPLTPLAFLERSADVFRDRTAVVHDGGSMTYAELAAAATRLANALRASGLSPGERVAYLCPNAPSLLVAHFGVPLAGGVLVAMNTRLAAEEILTICNHSGASVLVADTEFAGTVTPVRERMATVRELVWVDDTGTGRPDGGVAMEDLLARGSDEPLPWAVDDEDATISINYTSGTTGQPKGVMYTHRGTYLNALGEGLTAGHDHTTVYLWTLPMFHCNGWCHPWAIVATGGVQVCLRAVRGDAMWRAIREQRVTHMCGAPVVLSTLVHAPRPGRWGIR